MRRQEKIKVDCSFCKEKKDPDFMDSSTLSNYISDRGKILARSRTEICAKHQRKVSKSLKRARFLALIPFVVRPE